MYTETLRPPTGMWGPLRTRTNDPSRSKKIKKFRVGLREDQHNPICVNARSKLPIFEKGQPPTPPPIGGHSVSEMYILFKT